MGSEQQAVDWLNLQVMPLFWEWLGWKGPKCQFSPTLACNRKKYNLYCSVEGENGETKKNMKIRFHLIRAGGFLIFALFVIFAGKNSHWIHFALLSETQVSHGKRILRCTQRLQGA